MAFLHAILDILSRVRWDKVINAIRSPVLVNILIGVVITGAFAALGFILLLVLLLAHGSSF